MEFAYKVKKGDFTSERCKLSLWGNGANIPAGFKYLDAQNKLSQKITIFQENSCSRFFAYFIFFKYEN